MRKIIYILLLLTAFGLESAIAQKGLNNNSDLRVPINPNPSTTTPLLRIIVPKLPRFPAMPGSPAVSPIPTFLSGDLLPAIPSRPLIPTGLDLTAVITEVNTTIKIDDKLPILPLLPPIPLIPPMPVVRLTAY